MTMQGDIAELWFSGRWGNLRRNLTSVLRHHAPLVTGPLMECDMAGGRDQLESSWGAFLTAIVDDLDRRRRHAKGEWRDMFGMAISLLGEAALLRNGLLDHWERMTAAGLAERCDPEAEFLKVARIALRDMRKRVLPLSPDRQKTWSRLDRISRDLDRMSAHGNLGRCTRTHFREILAYCRQTFPDDKALPRTLDTIEEYFYENCPDCLEMLPDDASSGALADRHEFADILAPEEIMLLPDAERQIAKLSNCLKGLSQIEREVVEMSYDIGGVHYPSVAVFCSAREVSRRDFYALRTDAEVKLKDCVFAMRSS